MGSTPDGAIVIFYSPNPSAHNMALGLTQPLREMSTKGRRCIGLITLPPSRAELSRNSGSLELLEP